MLQDIVGGKQNSYSVIKINYALRQAVFKAEILREVSVPKLAPKTTNLLLSM